MTICMHLADEKDILPFSSALAAVLTPPLVLGFQGDLGAGKTTCIRALLRALGITGPIKSPTFSWVESYVLSNDVIHHFDLYRLKDAVCLNTFGFRDYFSEDAICCIEWPERAPALKAYIDVV